MPIAPFQIMSASSLVICNIRIISHGMASRADALIYLHWRGLSLLYVCGDLPFRPEQVSTTKGYPCTAVQSK